MSTAIRLANVSKRFTLHHRRSRSFQQLFLELFKSNHRRLGPETTAISPTLKEEPKEAFWALRDVSFSVEKGQTVGIIGPNAAGKSTVLKLISRIIEPTSGEIEVNGRVSALLELGAGFHPELTGRENIFLNGSILGLSRSEIEQRMDEIIAFAELERFIDMPVRHYSSGMYMRLGFSVAVHTEPDIVLVDEVLAVGDAAFQRKCLEEFHALRQRGITVLFVSHSAETVRQLCSRAIWLDEGQIVAGGPVEPVVARYLDQTWRNKSGIVTTSEEDQRRWGTSRVRISQARLLDEKGKERQSFRSGEPLIIEMQYLASEPIERPVFGVGIHRQDDLHIAGPNTQFSGFGIPSIEGEGVVRYRVDRLPLLEGLYSVSLAIRNWEDTEMFDYCDRLHAFRIVAPESGQQYGILALDGTWEHRSTDGGKDDTWA